MEKKLFSKLGPLLVKIYRIIDPDHMKAFKGDNCNIQIIDFVVKAVEERIERMSQGEGQ